MSLVQARLLHTSDLPFGHHPLCLLQQPQFITVSSTPSVSGRHVGEGAGQRRGGRCLPHSTAGTGPASRTTARRPVSLRTSATQRLESTSWPTSPCGQAPRVASRSTPPLQVLSHDPGLVSEVPLCGQTRTLRYLLRVPRCCRQALELLHSYQGSQP